MALMTHAPARLHTDYTTLTPAQQDRFDQLMEQADNAGPHDYPALMDAIAILAGLPTGELRRCGCSCYCPTIFDCNTADAHVIEHGQGYNLGRHQCPTCADYHRETA